MEPSLAFGVTHIGPVEVAGRDIHDHAVGESSTLTKNCLQIGAVRVCGEHAAGAKIQEEEAS